jgi:GntR family transcriptional regulator
MAQSLEEGPPVSAPEAAPDLARDDDLPVGVNLAWRLRALILSGRLGAGARLPGVRELAEGAGVNVNTARSIYRRLESEGLVVSRQGQGTFVLPHVATSPALEQLAADAAESARSLGVDPRDLARTLYAGSIPDKPTEEQSPAPADPGLSIAPPGEEEARAARRALRGQIARLEAELAAYPEARSERERHPLLRPKGHVASFAELSAIRDEMIELLKDARRKAARRG